MLSSSVSSKRKLSNTSFTKRLTTDFQPIPKDRYNNFSLKVASVIAQLNLQSQKIFSMSWSQNNSYLEIGQQLKISPKTVEIQILNVIRKFKELPYGKPESLNLLHLHNQNHINNASLNIDTGFRTRIVNIKKSKFQKVFIIDENVHLPVYKQLVTCVLKAIDEKMIEDGDRMPSISKTSAFLSVSQQEVQKAYYDLKKIGILTAIHGNGYFIIIHPCWRDNETQRNFQTLTNENYDLMIQIIWNKVCGLSSQEIKKESK